MPDKAVEAVGPRVILHVWVYIVLLSDVSGAPYDIERTTLLVNQPYNASPPPNPVSSCTASHSSTVAGNTSSYFRVKDVTRCLLYHRRIVDAVGKRVHYQPREDDYYGAARKRERDKEDDDYKLSKQNGDEEGRKTRRIMQNTRVHLYVFYFPFLSLSPEHTAALLDASTWLRVFGTK